MNKKIVPLILSMICLSSCQMTSKYESYKNASSYTLLENVGGNTYGISTRGEIKKLEVDWVKGNVNIIASDTYENITILEVNSSNKEKYRARFLREDTTFTLRYCESNVSMSKNITKDLTIYVPTSYSFEELVIANVSSPTTISNIKTDKLTIENVSGSSNVVNCKVNELKVDSVSGNFVATLSQSISSIDINQVSGNAIINLPEGFAGYNVSSFDTVSGKFTSDFGPTYSYGDVDYLNVKFNSVSGSLSIVKFTSNEDVVDKNSENETSGIPVEEDSGSWGELE